MVGIENGRLQLPKHWCCILTVPLNQVVQSGMLNLNRIRLPMRSLGTAGATRMMENPVRVGSVA